MNIRLRVLPQILPIDGRQIELQATATHIQWRYTGDEAWTDLIALSELVGPEGPATEFQVADGYIQYRTVGEGDWTDLVALTDITGPQGDQGIPGPQGPSVADGDKGDVVVSEGGTVWTVSSFDDFGVPSLDLQFTDAKAIDSAWFTGDGGDYIDQIGVTRTAPPNTIRIDHDPTTLQPLGMLVEETAEDYLNVPTDGWYAQAGGTILVEFINYSTAADSALFAIDAGLTDQANQIDVYMVNGTSLRARCRTGATQPASLNPGSFTVGSRTRLAFAFGLDDFAASVNGGTVVADTSGAMPAATLTRLRFAQRGTGTIVGDKHFLRFVYWPRRLTNDQLVKASKL